MSAPDYMAAIISFLKNDPNVGTVFGSRIIDDEEGDIPDWLANQMPVPVVVVKQTSGPVSIGGGANDFSDKHVDVRVYNITVKAARNSERIVFDSLRGMRRNVQSGTVLHWCQATGSPMAMRVQQINWPGGLTDWTTKWPYVQRTWHVLSADIPVSS